MSLHTRCLPRSARTLPYHIQWRRVPIRCYASSTDDDSPWFQQLRSEMLGRDCISSREYIDVNVDHKLIDTLCTFLPQEWCRRLCGNTQLVPIGHHLVWFNASMPVDKLLVDGTDPLHSPGEPWVRRMWAGGSVRIRPEAYFQQSTGFAAGSSMVCAERISDVQLRGHNDAAKIFVTIERRFTRLDTLHEKYMAPLRSLSNPTRRHLGPQWHFRQQLRNEDWGDAILIEKRNLVFLKDKALAELDAIRAGHMVPVRYLKPPGKPDFSHALTPTRSLLFRYSALTFNAHLIHLDREYARNVEGHRNLLVHGPLSLTLMLQAMAGYSEAKTGGSQVVESIEYRNLAPLYCDEKMRICGMRKKKPSREGSLYEVWIEGPTGGVAVKGTVRTVKRRVTGAQRMVQTSDTNNNPSGSLRMEDIHKKIADTSRMNIVSSETRNSKASGLNFESPGTRTKDAGKLVRFASRILTSLDSDRISENRRKPNSVKVRVVQTATSAPTGQHQDSARKTNLTKFSIPLVTEIATEKLPSPIEEVSTTIPRQSAVVSGQAPRRAYRRNRLPRETFPFDSSASQPKATFRRVQAPPSPMKPTQSYRTRILLRRSSRLRPAKFSIKPIPLVRKYRGEQYMYNSTDVARRHSRYRREGVRALQKPRIMRMKGTIARLVL